MKSRKPFSKLSIKGKFERLFWRGFSREEAEKKLQYPYKALMLPPKIIKLWQKALSSEEGLKQVCSDIGPFRMILPEFTEMYSPGGYDENLLSLIADRVCGDQFEYELGNCCSGNPYGFIITQYNGVFL
jgi:hypothetical protein